MKDAEWIDLMESIQVDRQVAADFLVMRKAKKAPLTMTALKRIQAEATRAGLTLQDALIECCTRGWTGFKGEWVKPAEWVKPVEQARPLYPVWQAESVTGHADQEARKRVLDALPPQFRRGVH